MPASAAPYLRLAGNPDDDGAFSRVVNFPPRGIGARSLEQVQELAQQQSMSLYAAAVDGIANGKITGRAASAISTFLKIVDGLKASWPQLRCRSWPMNVWKKAACVRTIWPSAKVRTGWKIWPSW